MKAHGKGLVTTLLLMTVTFSLMGYAWVHETAAKTESRAGKAQSLTIETKQVQKKIHHGSDGKLSVALHLNGADIEMQVNQKTQPVDIVVVLDRSGSMNGQKIEHAKMAVVQLMEMLSARDRLALHTYSDQVETVTPLVHMTESTRQQLISRVQRIFPGGGTNLGGGLQRGISTLMNEGAQARIRRVILISDGLANKGITAPRSLGSMAASASEHNLGISTVGVGYDFNEMLMTTIADHGAGNYYFLENPEAFASIFTQEFESSRHTVASSIEVVIPLQSGVELLDAGGFPITYKEDRAIIRPGDLRAGQMRKIFLSFKFPTNEEKHYTLNNISSTYFHNGSQQNALDQRKITVNCIKNKEEVLASIDKEVWSEQVVKDDYSRLKGEVADAIRLGKKEKALSKIKEYEERNRTLNDDMASPEVSKNLSEDVVTLRQSVNSTFAGSPGEVKGKRKQQAKAIQYESYNARRDKQK